VSTITIDHNIALPMMISTFLLTAFMHFKTFSWISYANQFLFAVLLFVN